ncbi:MAG: ribosomal protein S18-alanine N-acetyltransferase [Oxalobacter sp.]
MPDNMLHPTLGNAGLNDDRDLVFSPMQLKDLHDVYYIEQEVFPYHWTYRNFESSIATENQGIVLRNSEGILIGYFIALDIVDEMELLKIAVGKTFQGKGYGRILMDKVLELARLLEMESVFLEVRESNAPAIGLYKATGFKTVGIRPGYYVQPKEDALLMKLKL